MTFWLVDILVVKVKVRVRVRVKVRVKVRVRVSLTLTLTLTLTFALSERLQLLLGQLLPAHAQLVAQTRAQLRVRDPPRVVVVKQLEEAEPAPTVEVRVGREARVDRAREGLDLLGRRGAHLAQRRLPRAHLALG